eukprot:6869023-Prymnesium_polylepis.1
MAAPLAVASCRAAPPSARRRCAAHLATRQLRRDTLQARRPRRAAPRRLRCVRTRRGCSAPPRTLAHPAKYRGPGCCCPSRAARSAAPSSTSRARSSTRAGPSLGSHPGT